MEEPRKIWDRRYSQSITAKTKASDENWLDCWQPLLETSRAVPLLELGCGRGVDTAYLTMKGFQVVAADYSSPALSIVRQQLRSPRIVQLDLRQGLPFSADQFQVAIASLSLHYFPWDRTQGIIGEIQNCLTRDGFLLARFNSVNDVHHGASSESGGETHYIFVNGMMKHFFDGARLKRLFEVGWRIETLEEKVIQRYAKPKVVWEVVVRKVNQS